MISSIMSETARRHFFTALELYENEEYEAAAAEALLASKANNGTFPEADLLVAHCYWVGEGFSGEDLVKQLEKIVKADPDDAGSWLLLALQTRTVRDKLFAGAIERKSVSWHRDADKYFKKSQKAFHEARARFPAFTRSPRHAFSFYLSGNLPLLAGDYVVESETMPIKDAFGWYQTVLDYDAEAIASAMKNAGVFEEEDELADVRKNIEEVKTTAQRKLALLENSAASKKKRNTGVERTMNQKLLINIVVAAVVFLFLCWGLYALIT